MHLIMERVKRDPYCRVSFGEVRVSDLVFVDDATLLAEFVVSPLGLQVSSTKTNI